LVIVGVSGAHLPVQESRLSPVWSNCHANLVKVYLFLKIKQIEWRARFALRLFLQKELQYEKTGQSKIASTGSPAVALGSGLGMVHEFSTCQRVIKSIAALPWTAGSAREGHSPVIVVCFETGAAERHAST